MKVSKDWLKELIDLDRPVDEVMDLLPKRTIGIKEVTKDFFELDMKGYNRADLLSLRGVAQEIAAITVSRVKGQGSSQEDFIWSKNKFETTPIGIEDLQLSPVQCVTRIEGLTVQASPANWVKKLHDSGIRSINNLVDITNLIMLEYGQPLHAFDAQAVKDHTINVRLARKGEVLTTLDDKRRVLTDADIVLSDDEKALDVAGIMGGKDTEIKPSTTTILLSASMFNPQHVRRTASRLNLHSEASRRFQHGLTMQGLLQAYSAAIKMYQAIGGKVTALSLKGDFQTVPINLILHYSKINNLIGTVLSKKEIESILGRLQFTVKTVDENTWQVSPPYFRLDCQQEEDIIEEIARLYGYEKIPKSPLPGSPPSKIDQSKFEFIHQLKKSLATVGLKEVQTYSFFSTQVLGSLGTDQRQLVKILNPISAETAYLRNALWPNLLEVVSFNLKHFKDVAIFEIGKVFNLQPGELPKESYFLSIALSNDTDNPTEELYQLIKKALEMLYIGFKVESREKQDYFHPARQQRIQSGKFSSGILAEVHPRVINKFGSDKRIPIIELE